MYRRTDGRAAPRRWSWRPGRPGRGRAGGGGGGGGGEPVGAHGFPGFCRTGEPDDQRSVLADSRAEGVAHASPPSVATGSPLTATTWPSSMTTPTLPEVSTRSSHT